MKKICVYCGTTIEPGPEPASHGVCEDCLPRLEADMEPDRVSPAIEAMKDAVRVYNELIMEGVIT